MQIYQQLKQTVTASQYIVSVIWLLHVADFELQHIKVRIHRKEINSLWSQQKAFRMMHHRLKSLSIRSWADELPKPRFSYQVLAATEPAWAQKKELADMNSISQHTNPGR